MAVRFMQGNEAVFEGAVAAGARFYAGYPITPSSEIAELAARRLPGAGGAFIQMEDELGSMAAIIGASLAGKKSFTATSGPGFSLMQENLGLAAMAEVPCVVINVMRSGPSTGLATKPAQADVMQARWGTHGDHAIIALAPSSVQDCFDLTVKAFNLAERFRTPVVLLSDEVVGHMRERVVIPEDGVELVDRKKPTCPPDEYLPYQAGADGVAPLASYGSDYIFHINGSMHGESGYPQNDPANAGKVIRRLTDKIERCRDEIAITRRYHLDDAEVVLISFGATARSALETVLMLRDQGVKAGLLQLVILWPFPESAVREAALKAKVVIVPEMNLGQVIGEVRRVLGPSEAGLSASAPAVAGYNKSNGEAITPEEILGRVQEILAQVEGALGKASGRTAEAGSAKVQDAGKEGAHGRS